MIDLRLFVAIAVAIGVPAAAGRWWWPPRTLKGKVLDQAWLAVGAGAVAARVAALVVDDPASFASLRLLLQIRSGMELWPGVAVAMVVWGLEGRSDWVDASDRLADLAPFALLSYAAYEVSCLWRDGCFGPPSRIGLAPGGSGPAELPIGVAVAAAIVALAALVRSRHGRPREAVALAVLGLAAVRSVASFWLPNVSTSLTRQHLESVVVAVGAAFVWIVLRLRRPKLSPV